jgi:hypothetical protein
MPAMRRSNCTRLGAGHPPFVWASCRPVAVLRRSNLSARRAATPGIGDWRLYGALAAGIVSVTTRGDQVAWRKPVRV